MNCGLIVLWVGSIDVRGKKGESGACKPIDTANSVVIELFLTRKIRIEGFNGRNEINGEHRMIWIHVGNLVCNLIRELMSCEFIESKLA